MRHQLSQNGRELIPHYLGQIGKRRIRKLMQIRRIESQPLARALHRRSKVWTEVFLSNGDGNVSHAFESATAEGVCFLFLEFHEFGHEGGYAHDVGGEFFFSGDCRGGEGGHGHFLHGALACGLQHGCQLSYQGVEEGTHTLGFQPLAKHFQHITARGLHGNVGIVQQCKDNGQNLTRVCQHLRLAVFANLPQGEARAFSYAGISVPRALEHMGHD
mmetsp:Transcript_321/g.616  ORF Transcript_321/g.616 Transcript_321/m.616 type:complete len:216 (-) Transcript_321:1368-2015(-)